MTTITVSAAASLSDALREIAKQFGKANPQARVRFNFGASGTLERQIRQGAPVDVFVSASPKEMDALGLANLLLPQTRVNIAGNRLVLIVPKTGQGGAKGITIGDWDDLRLPQVRRVALSNPAFVPSGRYAQETLTQRGLWQAVRAKAVLGENVRQTLAYVAGHNVDAGIVFATDAREAKGQVVTIATAKPGVDHTPIVYPAAVIATTKEAATARQFVQFLVGPNAQATLRRYGFTPAPVIISVVTPAQSAR